MLFMVERVAAAFARPLLMFAVPLVFAVVQGRDGGGRGGEELAREATCWIRSRSRLKSDGGRERFCG